VCSMRRNQCGENIIKRQPCRAFNGHATAFAINRRAPRQLSLPMPVPAEKRDPFGYAGPCFSAPEIKRRQTHRADATKGPEDNGHSRLSEPPLTAFTLYKFAHILGIILLLGNITVTAVWKVFADRTRNASIVSFGQRMVTGTDFGLTVPGIVLTIVGGYGAMYEARYDFPGPAWLLWSQLSFIAAGIIWLGLLIPIQVKQARMAHAFAGAAEVPEEYRRLARLWLIWGLIATVPLISALYFMIEKPG